MKFFLFTLFVLINGVSYSQSVGQPCVTDVLLKNLTDNFPEVKQRLESFEEVLRNTRIDTTNKFENAIPVPGSITIPVVVYVVHDGTALTNISDAQVVTQISALNDYFFNTGIKFCLGTKVNGANPIPTVNASDVQTTAGIIHVNNAILSNHFSNAQQGLVDTANTQITKDRYLRIWVVKSIDGTASGILGYSMFPNTSYVFDGIVMRYDTFGNGNPNMLVNYNLGKVLVHEVGHYLGLYHTFEGGCSTITGDCSTDGDRVCDTPRIAAPNFNCITGTNSCVETPTILDDLSNYMDYGNNYCQDHFTNGQIERMLAVLSSSRSSLYTTQNLIYTATCGTSSLISSTITPSNFTPCASSTVATTFDAPFATTYSWDFGDNFATVSNPNTANTQNASHIYTSAANSPYTVTLTVTNSSGNSSISSEKIYVTDCASINNNNAYWYVSNHCGLDFATGRPIFDVTFPYSNLNNLSCNSQCDTNGDLLFYTNSFKVWNKQHAQINASDLMNNNNGRTSYQVVIVPKPPLVGNEISEYYIFAQQPHFESASDRGFRYNIVNVSGTTATMGVMQQPIILPATYGFDTAADGALLGSNGISAVKKCDGNDYWILATLKKGSTLYLVVFSLTSSGLTYQSERILTTIGGGYAPDNMIEMSPNGNKLLFWNPHNSVYTSRIYDFNKAEGLVSSAFSSIALPQSTGLYGQMFGCSFSPDSNLIYSTDHFGKKIYQFNINSINVNNSRKEIASTLPALWSMQMGPDNKLYITMTGIGYNQKLSVIHNPNELSTTENPNACNFTTNGPNATVPNATASPALPNVIDAKQETAYFEPNTPNVICKYITACNTYKFFPNVCGTSFVWTFTNTTLGTSTTTTATNPTYNFAQNGTYIVTVKNSANELLGTSSPIVITNASASVITGSTTACLDRLNEKITNNSTTVNTEESVTWSITGGVGTITGSINNQPSVNINWTSLPGIITLTKVNAAGCTSVTTQTITAYCQLLGIETFSREDITVSPNPSSGLFTINIPNFIGKIDLQVVDVYGRIILKESDSITTGGKNIDLSNCLSGMYIIKINGSEFTYSQKIIKN